MGLFDFMQTKKSVSEQEEENESLRVENENMDLKLSLKQKKALYEEMKLNHLSLKNFGGSLRGAWAWFKGH
jgi:regulator of replication initiation timing